MSDPIRLREIASALWEKGMTSAAVVNEAADALEAQARELAEVKAAGYAGELAKRLAEAERDRDWNATQWLKCNATRTEYMAKLAAAERELKRYAWLVDHGERCFGSLWREASVGDIDAAMKEGK